MILAVQILSLGHVVLKTKEKNLELEVKNSRPGKVLEVLNLDRVFKSGRILKKNVCTILCRVCFCVIANNGSMTTCQYY